MPSHKYCPSMPHIVAVGLFTLSSGSTFFLSSDATVRSPAGTPALVLSMYIGLQILEQNIT